MDCGFLSKLMKKNERKWAGLAALFSRYSQTAPTIFFSYFQDIFFDDFIKNPQTTITPTFFMHIISAIGGVAMHDCITCTFVTTQGYNFKTKLFSNFSFMFLNPNIFFQFEL